ncbi:hypothetical protein HDU99_002078, partial [Rhizoclosmatium hyalinum]
SLERALLKWVNSTLKKQNAQLHVSNFGSDLKDGAALAYLISSFDDNVSQAEEILKEQDINKRAELVLQYAQQYDCRHFASAADIVDGNKNLNLAFVAVLHNLKVSRDKAQQIRIQLEGAKENAEAALLRVNSSREVESKKLKLQLNDAREEAERLRQERDQLRNLLEEFKEQAQDQEAVYAENGKLLEKLNALEDELQQSRNINDQVTSSFESITDTLAQVVSSEQDVSKQLQLQNNRIIELQAEVDYYKQLVRELEDDNRELRKQLAALKETDSYLSLHNLSAPFTSLNNVSDNQEDLAQQLAASKALSQSLQYELLALQSDKDEKSQELEQALQRAERAEEKVQLSTESLAQLYAQTKLSKGDISNKSTEFQKKQEQLEKSIDTLYEEALALQLMSKDDPERERLLQEQIRHMQNITVQLVQQANMNEAEVIERVLSDLHKHQGLFDKLQLKERSQRDLVSALAEFVSQLNRKAVDNEKKVEALSKSIDTLNDELQKKTQAEQQQQQLQQSSQQQLQQKSNGFRDADIDESAANVAKEARKQMYSQLNDEKERLQDRLAILQRTTAAIMEQRSILIEENNRLLNNESGEALNLSRQIQSLDQLLAANAKFREELEMGSQEHLNSNMNLEQLALKQARVQKQVNEMINSEDCLIEDLTNMKEANEELQERLEHAQRCISALMQQRSILLQDRDELKAQLSVAKSQQSLAASNDGLYKTKHNNSFASAPNLASKQ